MLGRCAQRHGDIVGHLVSSYGDHPGMAYGAVGKDGDVGGAAADVHQAHTQVPFVFSQHRVAGGELFEDDLLHFQAAAANTFLDILGGVDGAGHQVHLGLQAHSRHPHGLLDTLLAVDDILLGQDVQDFLVRGDCHGLGRVYNPLQVVAVDLLVLDGDDAVGIQAADMAAGNSHVDRVYLAARHQLGLLHRPLNGLHGGLDIDHHPLLHPLGGVRADPDHLHIALWPDFPDDRHHLGRADVQADDHLFVLYAAHGSVSPVLPVY